MKKLERFKENETFSCLYQPNISYDENKITLDDIDRFIEEAGYKSLGIYDIKKEYLIFSYSLLFIIRLT